ncbi:MAG TPA: Fe-S cluster assembly protein SufD [Pyrinomonadaceae bacterium]
MSHAVIEKSSYVDAFRESRRLAGGSLPRWFDNLRGGSIERFEEVGFPTTDEEDWKYTNVAPIARRVFHPASGQAEAAFDSSLIGPYAYQESKGSRVVFVDGIYRADLSSLEGLPAGVEVSQLTDALEGEHSEVVRKHLEVAAAADSFAALNTALFDAGLLLRIGRGVVVESPIQLLFLAASEREDTAAFPRVLIVSEPQSSATVIETYDAVGDQVYFTDSVVEARVGDGARLVHYRVQREGERAFHVASTRAELGRAAHYDLTTITLGAQLSRHNVEVSLDNEGAECWVDGLYLVGTGQHTDTHSLIDHRVPRCVSHQNYKGILDGRSRAVFNGRVYVHPDAQQTDAFQSNKNLLLSNEARVDTKPQLEIFADDVKCAHGATVGQLAEEELFYLVSRGLRPALARNLLTYGFAEEIVEKIKIGSIKRQLDEAILNRLHAEFEAQ